MKTIINYNEDIVDKDYVLYFYANWMIGNKKMLTILEKLEKEFNINIYNVDVDSIKELVNKYNIKSIPEIIFLKDKKIKKRVNGMSLIGPIRKIFNDIYKNQKEI